MKKRFTEEQIIPILKEAEAGLPVKELCRKYNISDATFYTWRKKYGGLEVSEARRLKALEEENARLKKLLAESMLDTEALKAALNRKYGPSGTSARLCAPCCRRRRYPSAKPVHSSGYPAQRCDISLSVPQKSVS